MRTLKFKAQPTNAFFATVNQMLDGSSQLPTTAERAVIKSKSFRQHSRTGRGGAGSPSQNALRMNYIINRRLSRDLLVVSGVHGVKSTVS